MKDTGLQVSAKRAEEKPQYGKTAAELLKACRAFYEDPENEKAFREWQKDGQKKSRLSVAS